METPIWFIAAVAVFLTGNGFYRYLRERSALERKHHGPVTPKGEAIFETVVGAAFFVASVGAWAGWWWVAMLGGGMAVLMMVGGAFRVGLWLLVKWMFRERS